MQVCCLRPTIGYGDTAQNRFSIAFGVDLINVEIAVLVKTQLNGWLLSATSAVFLQQLMIENGLYGNL